MEPLSQLAVLHEPTRRLGTEPNAAAEDEGGNECGAELKAPGNRSGVFYDHVGAESQEDAYGRGWSVNWKSKTLSPRLFFPQPPSSSPNQPKQEKRKTIKKGGGKRDLGRVGGGHAELLTDHDPELPKHDEGTPNTSRGHLGRVYGDCGILCTDSDSQDESRGKESLP